MNEKQKAAMYLAQLEQAEHNPVKYEPDYPSEHYPAEKKLTAEKEKAHQYLDQLNQVQEEESLGETARRQVGRLGRIAATGAASIGGIPNLAALGLHAAGLRESPEFYPDPAHYVQEKIDTLTGGRLKPRNKAEEYMDIIGEGAAPAVLTGGAGLIGHGIKHAAKAVAKGLTGKAAAANVGSSVAAKQYIDTAENPSPLGVLAASILGGKAGSIARTLPTSAAYGMGKLTGFSPQKYATQTALGLPVSVSSVSKSAVPTYIEMAAAKTPGSMGPLEKQYIAKEQALARNLGIANPSDLEQAVTAPAKHLARQGAKGFHKRASAHYQKRSEKFAPREVQAITDKELADVSQVINTLEQERGQFVKPQVNFDPTPQGKLLASLRKSLPESPYEDLKRQGYPHDVITKLMEADTQHQGIGYKDLNTLREKALQEAIQAQTPMGGSTPKSRAATQRSELLSKARHENMERIGNKVERHNAREARLFWARYRNEENGMAEYVQKLTDADNDASAFTKLNSDNPKYLNVVRQGLPKQQHNRLFESLIADDGNVQGRFNIATAHRKFTSLEEPVKQERLKLLPSKAARENFLGTMKYIGDHKREMAKLANTSNTAHSTAMMDLIKKYGAASAAVATGVKVGAFIPLIATYAGLKLGAHLWTNQNFLKRMNEAAKASSSRSQANHVDLLLKSINSAANQAAYQHEAADKRQKRLHIMMTPSRAFQIN